ncbi:hypothetical protein [Exiguobacterium flavidum]|uniref:hypothetical protein n=1 Tax=Exiguobacterium flavidum TaxID=2184695 RepID=UPI000DF837A4|nr:hypothetical protein [Exiguobacterium flavidum]
MNEIPLSNGWTLRYSPVMDLWLKEDGVLLVDHDDKVRLMLVLDEETMEIKRIDEDNAHFSINPVTRRLTFELGEDEEESEPRYWE